MQYLIMNAHFWNFGLSIWNFVSNKLQNVSTDFNGNCRKLNENFDINSDLLQGLEGIKGIPK